MTLFLAGSKHNPGLISVFCTRMGSRFKSFMVIKPFVKFTFETTSAVSRKSLHLPVFDLAKKSSISLTPIL